MKHTRIIAAVFCGLLLLSATSRAQNLYVGSNAANVTTNFTSGTNIFGITYIGYSTNLTLIDPTNNVLNVSGAGTVLSNSSFLHVGLNGSGNRLVVSNDGQVYCQNGVLGWTENAGNNSALVTGTNSKWTVGGDLTLGGRASEISIAPDGNSLVVSNGGQVVIVGALRIGVFSRSNSVLVTGSGSSVQGSVIMGGFATSLRNNSLVISNGGRVSGGYGYIGNWSSNSTALVTGTNSVWTNSGNLYVGYDSLGKGNRLVISNGATVANAEGIVGGGAISTNSAVQIASGASLRLDGYYAPADTKGELAGR
ncbi:MAG: hypothetical protein EBV06_18155, partial [Planctomycetia bacterium]|nr:hypothetical protein [Planctomycetia bacterium]